MFYININARHIKDKTISIRECKQNKIFSIDTSSLRRFHCNDIIQTEREEKKQLSIQFGICHINDTYRQMHETHFPHTVILTYPKLPYAL